MGTFFDGWVASESQDHDAIKVKRLYVDINEGNWFDAAMFSQIMYWHGFNKENGARRLQIFRDGHFWLAKRYEDWWAECRVNAETAKKAINRMIIRGLLVKEVWLFQGKPTVHLRINIEGFEVLANHTIAEAKEFELNRSNVPDGKGTRDQMEKVQETNSYTETTTQTTTETKEKEIPAPQAAADSAPALHEVPKPTPSKKKRTSPHEPEFNELVQCFKVEKLTRIGSRPYWNVAAQLHEIGFPVDRIRGLHIYVKAKQQREGWSGFTVNALGKYAGEYLRDSPARGVLTASPPPAPEPLPAVAGGETQHYPDVATMIADLARQKSGNRK